MRIKPEDKPILLIYAIGLPILFFFLTFGNARADATLLGASMTSVSGSASITIPASTDFTICALRNVTNGASASAVAFAGITATHLVTMSDSNTGMVNEIYYAETVSTGSQTFAFTGYSDAQFWCWFLSGVDPTGIEYNEGTSSPSITTTADGIVLGYQDNNGGGATTGSAPLVDTYSVGSGYRMVDSGTVLTAGLHGNTWTTGAAMNSILIGLPSAAGEEPPPEEGDAGLTATSTPNQIQQNLFNGFMIFFISFYGMVWLIRKR